VCSSDLIGQELLQQRHRRTFYKVTFRQVLVPNIVNFYCSRLTKIYKFTFLDLGPV